MSKETLGDLVHRLLIIEKLKISLFADFIENTLYRLVLHTKRNIMLFQCLSSSRSY